MYVYLHAFLMLQIIIYNVNTILCDFMEKVYRIHLSKTYFAQHFGHGGCRLCLIVLKESGMQGNCSSVPCVPASGVHLFTPTAVHLFTALKIL